MFFVEAIIGRSLSLRIVPLRDVASAERLHWPLVYDPCGPTIAGPS